MTAAEIRWRCERLPQLLQTQSRHEALANAEFEARHKLGQALSAEQQVFVSEHWQKVDVFLASEKGRVAAALFVDEWIDSMK